MTFALLSVLAYRGAGGRAGWRGYLLSLSCFAAAVLSKAVVALLPCFFLLVDRLDGPPALATGRRRGRPRPPRARSARRRHSFSSRPRPWP